MAKYTCRDGHLTTYITPNSTAKPKQFRVCATCYSTATLNEVKREAAKSGNTGGKGKRRSRGRKTS